jgi:hypothetical protein
MAHKVNMVECRAVIDFLDTFSSSSTKESYKSFINRFFNWLDIKPDDYIKSTRDFANDIYKFEKYNTDKKLAPLSRKQTLVGIKKFLEHHDIDI